MFLSFSKQNHAESSGNFVKKLSFGPEMCEIGPTVVIWTCPDLPRPVQEDKYLLQTSGNSFSKTHIFTQKIIKKNANKKKKDVKSE